MQHRGNVWLWRVVATLAIIVTAPLVMAGKAPTPAPHVAHPHATTDEWPTFMHDARRSGSSADTTISTANAAQLTKLWSFHTGGGIAAQPTVVGGVVYVGSWDGNMYALNASTGALIWKTFLGQTTTPLCQPQTIGITSAAAVQNGIVYVGGGDTYWYALDATTGAVLWKVYTGDNSVTGGYYNWSSPLLYNGYGYIGIASNCDNPLAQGMLMQVDLTSHSVVKTVPLVPTGQVGGGIWTSPSVDPATNTIYVTTGTKNQPTQSLAQAMLAFDATTLVQKGGWQIPEADAVVDSDWGASPTLYDDAQGRHWVVASNKDGYLYAFDRTNINAGPIWRQTISIGGACPTCGDGSIATTAFANNTVYVAGGNTTLHNGKGYPGSVRALDPTTGNILWEHGDAGPVVPAVTWANGLLITEPGNDVEVLDASSGARLWSYATGGPLYAAASVAEGAIYTGSTDGNIYAFAPGSAATPPADGACPASWSCGDIGSPSPAGSESVAAGTWTVSAGGAGLAAPSDQIRLMAQTATGDTQVTAGIAHITTGMAGVMLRQSTDPGAPFYALSATPANTIAVASRTAFGGAITTTSTVGGTLPITLRVLRQGDTFAAATSPDGTTFTLVPGSTVNLMLPTTTLAGIWASSGATGTAMSATFTGPTVAAAGAVPPSPAPAIPCPASWSCADVGDPQVVGNQSLSNGTWTVGGAGLDIAGYSDQFHYVWQSVAGDATASAHIATQTNTAGGAKAGIMLRASTDPGAAFYGLFARPSSGLTVIYRPTSGLRVAQIAVGGAVPAYVQIQRSGSTFTAWTSTNGTSWSYVPGTNITLNATGAMLAGLAVTSNNAGTVNTATFDSVGIVGSAPAAPVVCPTQWTCADIGYPLPPGSQSTNSTQSAWSVIAGGSDLYGMTDQFRLVAQSLPGDGTFSARVLTQTDTNDWAKAGVMIRSTTDPASPYYGMFLTPGHGVVVQWRSSQGGNTGQLVVAATTAYPTFVEVGRVGNVFTAYTSPDGSTWTAVAGSSLTIPMAGVALAGLAVTAHNNGTQGVVTFDKVVLVSTCLAGWSCTDIGDTVAIAGGNAFINNTWMVYGGGADIWALRDQFHYLWQVQPGDGSISAQVTAQTATDPNAKAGLMFRQSVDPASPYYAVYLTPGNGVAVQYRTATGQYAGQAATLAGTAPVYLKITRSGYGYTAYTSANGTTWTLIPGSAVNLTVSGPMLAGLAVTGHNVGLLGSATFAAVSLNVPPPPTCPAGWTCADIGTPPLSGGQTLANGTWTITGNGTDIWATADQFHYVWQGISGDATISARVTAQANTDPNAKAGLMFRQTSDPASPFYDLMVTPGNGLTVQYRTTQGAYTGQQTTLTGTVPAWLEVVRQGNIFSAYTSTDGATWTLIPNSTKTIGNPGAFLVGMAVTSHQVTALGSATFTTVTLTLPTVITCPTGWTCTDVGPMTLAGSQTLSNGTWTVSGGGTDIWGTGDQFHYVYQTTAGDNALAAHITAQTNTSAWAKAGLMFRLSTDPGSPFYAVYVTPGNGVAVQYRATQGGNPGSAGGIATATLPQYIRVLRAGTTFTAYTSADGATWTLVPGSSKTLPALTGSLLLGLAITAHNGTALGSATLDSVAFATPNATTTARRKPHGPRAM